MSDSKTIALFSGYFLPFLGGVERFTEKLSEQLLNMGYKIIIVTTKHDNLPDVEDRNGRRIYRFPSKKIFKNRYPILDKNKDYKQLLEDLQQEDIDYVICNTRFQLTTLFGLKFAKQKGLPSLVIDHGSSHFSVNNKILDVFGAIYEHGLTRYLKQYPAHYYAVSKKSADWLSHFNIKSDGVIYNSVDADLYDRFGTSIFSEELIGKTVITYAGRLIREKGIELLLQAYSEIPESHDKVLMVAGDGPILEELKESYQRDDIHFLGKLDFEETMSLMNQTDIFVYPSMFPEGLPTSILEAGSMKSAVIATDRGGTKEVIIDSSLGIIIEEEKDALYNALLKLMTDDQYRLEIQENLFIRVREKFVWTTTAKKVDCILRKL